MLNYQPQNQFSTFFGNKILFVMYICIYYIAIIMFAQSYDMSDIGLMNCLRVFEAAVTVK